MWDAGTSIQGGVSTLTGVRELCSPSPLGLARVRYERAYFKLSLTRRAG